MCTVYKKPSTSAWARLGLSPALAVTGQKHLDHRPLPMLKKKLAAGCSLCFFDVVIELCKVHYDSIFNKMLTFYYVCFPELQE